MTTTAYELTGPHRAGFELRLAARQLVYEQRAFWRNRTRAFFNFALPLMFLVIFGSLNRSDVLDSHGGIHADVYVIPGLLAYGVILATFQNLVTETAGLRDSGVLKRMRGTPLPYTTYLAARIASAVVVAAGVVVVTLVIARVAYDVHVRMSTLPGLAATLVIGTGCFAALGLGTVLVVKNAESAPAVASALILPLTFISGVWGDFGGMPAWLDRIAGIFPVKHLADGLQVAFDPRTTGSGIVGSDLLVLAVWLAVGLFFALRFLRREHRRS
jgi:ABC-2 type transport system permease protein